METVSKCISSPHFQIAERMLFLWNNQYLTSPDALLGTSYTKEVLPLVIGALIETAGPDDDDGSNGPSGHWNPTVKQLTNSVIKMYSKGDAKLYDSILVNHLTLKREKDKMRIKNDSRWEDITNNR
jgi:serine/threonine-protein phosphatase 2A regulatory subunit B'